MNERGQAAAGLVEAHPLITELEFKSLALQGYNRIPLIAEAFADLETPLSLYLKLAHARDGGKHSFLLESVVGGERFGRYSFIGLPARTLLRVQRLWRRRDDRGRHGRPGGRNRPRQSAGLHRAIPAALQGGAASRACHGFAAAWPATSATTRCATSRRSWRRRCPPDTLGCPDILLLQCEELAVIDNLSGKLYLIVYADPSQGEAYADGKKRLRELRDLLKYSVSAPVIRQTQGFPAEREFAKADYIAAVERAKELIAAGDFMQVQVGQRIKKRYTESPLSLYRALRSLNPSPYMYYYHFGDFHVVGASPEILVRQEQTPEGQKITIRPLAGTRPRGATPERDKAVEQELINDPKERAEHVMLIDLARNDIGRIAKTGTVKVTEAFAVERYSHVMHIVSNVEGILNDGMTSIDVLKATFPAGTLTGAPKVHAMELIDQLEPSKRGLYGGACGYLSYAGDMDVAIAIRTGIIKDQTLYVQAAAGVVADSVPELEWKETEAKARALLRASELVEEGLE